MRYSTNDSPTMKGQTSIDAQEHPIEAVTLYSQRAEVRRAISLELKTGRNEFAITNLPSLIVPETFHVSGLSAGQASVVDTTCTIPKAKFSLFDGLAATKPKAELEKHNKASAELEMKKNQLLREKSLIYTKNDVLLAYAKTLTGENTLQEDFVEFINQFNNQVQDSLTTMNQIEAALEEVETSIKKLDIKDQEDEDDDQDLTSKQKTKATVVISAKEDCSVELVLTYVISGARWVPTYELHATTDETTNTISNSVTLHYRASVVQNTGEDWSDVNLTLSTAELSTSTVVPVLARTVIRDAPPNGGAVAFNNAAKKPDNRGLFGNIPPPPVFGSSTFGSTGTTSMPGGFATFAGPGAMGFGTQTVPQGGAFGAPAPYATGFFRSTPAAQSYGLFGSAAPTTEPHQSGEAGSQSPVLVAANPEFQPLDHGSAEAKDQVLASTYRVDTPVRVQSDNTPHRVTIMTVQLAAKTEYVVVPSLTRSAYLQCKVTNTSSHQFPPGLMVTYLDGSYVEKTSIPLVLPKSKFTRSLGTNPGIRVFFKRNKEIKNPQHAAVFGRQTVTIVTDTLTVKNTRKTAIPLVLVRHAIPTPGGDDRFRVTLKEPGELVQLEAGSSFKLRDHVTARWTDEFNFANATSGLMEWSIEQLAVEGTQEIKLVYEVAAPEGIKWAQL